MKWLELRLGRLPHTLAWHEIDTLVRAVLAQRGYLKKTLSSGEMEFDVILGILLLKTDLWQLKQLSAMPEVLEQLDLIMASCALKFALGYEDELPESLDQPGVSRRPSISLLGFGETSRPQRSCRSVLPCMRDGKSSLMSNILGCKVVVESENLSPCVEVAECILAALESFLATGAHHHVYAREPVLALKIRRSDFVEGPYSFETVDIAGRPLITVSCGDFSPNSMSRETQGEAKKRLFDLLVHILTRVFLVQDIEKLIRDLFQDEAALQRSIDFTSSFVTAGNVLGHSPKTNIDLWADPKARNFALKRDAEWDSDERRTRPRKELGTRASTANETGTEPPAWLTKPEGVKHTQMETVSLIREKLWDRAVWSGTGFLLTPGDAQPPILALIFKDREAASEIFAEWRKEFGKRDEKNLLRLSIVRGINKNKPFYYRVVIGTNPTMENLSTWHSVFYDVTTERNGSSD